MKRGPIKAFEIPRHLANAAGSHFATNLRFAFLAFVCRNIEVCVITTVRTPRKRHMMAGGTDVLLIDPIEQEAPQITECSR
jgi:hypothetical protein